MPRIRVAGLGGPRFAAAGGTLVDDYRDIAVTGLTEAIAQAAAIVRRPPPAGRGRRDRASGRADPDRLSRLQLPAGAADQAPGRPGHLLHRPADLGVARRAADDDPRDRGPRPGHLSLRGSDLPRGRRAGGVRRPSADRSRAAVGRTRGVSLGARDGAVGADRRDPARLAPERGVADSSRPRRRGASASGPPCPARSSSSRARPHLDERLFAPVRRAARRGGAGRHRRRRHRHGAGVGRRRAHGIGHRHRPDRAARHADGHRLSRVAPFVPAGCGGS